MVALAPCTVSWPNPPPVQGPVYPRHVQTCSTWTSEYSPPPRDMFRLFVQYVARTVDKQAIFIQPKCLLVWRFVGNMSVSDSVSVLVPFLIKKTYVHEFSRKQPQI